VRIRYGIQCVISLIYTGNPTGPTVQTLGPPDVISTSLSALPDADQPLNWKICFEKKRDNKIKWEQGMRCSFF